MSSNVQTKLPGPKPADNLLSQINLAMEFDRDAIGLIMRGFRDYGDVWQISAGKSVQFMFAHPDHFHEILLEKTDKFHKDKDYKDTQKGLARFMGNGIVTRSSLRSILSVLKAMLKRWWNIRWRRLPHGVTARCWMLTTR